MFTDNIRRDEYMSMITFKYAATEGVAVKSGVYCDDAMCDVSTFRAHVPQTTAV